MPHDTHLDSTTFDLVIVGAGVAGWTAARRSQDLGLRVMVVEKAPQAPGWGNGRLSGGVFHAGYHDPHRPPAELAEALIAAGSGAVDHDVAWAWARNCGRALDFLTAEGARFERQTDEEWQWNVLAPFQPLELGQPWQGAGPDRFLTMMWQRFVARGGFTMFGARARRLVFRDGRVRGVVVECGTRVSTIDAHNVLIADGGFQANSEMVREFITPVYRLRAADTGTGDGIAMARALGADVVNMEWFYGHCMTRDALWNNRLWPMFSMYAVIAASLVVDGSGRRFADEGVSNQHMANAISKSTTPGNCWVVFDDTVWQTVARAEPLPANPILTDERATIVSAASVAALAPLLDMTVGALGDSVARFNGYAETGQAIWPPRTGSAHAIRAQPVHAVPVIAGITFTMGGLRVDATARVRDRDGALIAGLYAAGGAMGGLQGGPKPAYAGGWSEAATFGMLAAEHVAEGSGTGR